MFCPKCGTKNLGNAQFCENCGTKLNNTKKQHFTYTNERKKPSSVIVVLGYIFAILGGLFGFLIGLYLLSGHNSEATFHGRNIIIIAVISMVLGLVLVWY